MHGRVHSQTIRVEPLRTQPLIPVRGYSGHSGEGGILPCDMGAIGPRVAKEHSSVSGNGRATAAIPPPVVEVVARLVVVWLLRLLVVWLVRVLCGCSVGVASVSCGWHVGVGPVETLAGVGYAGAGSVRSELLSSFLSERRELCSPPCPAVVGVAEVRNQFCPVAKCSLAHWAVGAFDVVVGVGVLLVHSTAVGAHSPLRE